MKDRHQHGEYVQKVVKDTQQYVEHLLKEHEKLRLLSASLERDRQLLETQVESLRQNLARQESQTLSLQQHIESENRKFVEQYSQVEQQNAGLANLYVASYRLHSSLDRQEVLSIIQEIVINIVGSEELAILKLNPKTAEVSLLSSLGVDEERCRRLAREPGPLRDTLSTGRTYISDSAGAAITACIPLTLEEKITGAIVVFRLLPQKPALEPVDRELFDLLATHAATSLYCSELHAKLGATHR